MVIAGRTEVPLTKLLQLLATVLHCQLAMVPGCTACLWATFCGKGLQPDPAVTDYATLQACLDMLGTTKHAAGGCALFYYLWGPA